MKINNKNLVVLSLLGSFGLGACGGGGGGSNANTTPNSDLVYSADASVNGTYELFSNTREGNEHATLTQGSFGSGVNRNFQVSPNGRYVAFRNEGNMPDVSELYVDDLDDDLPPIKVNDDFVSLVSQATSQVFSFKWSPNSDKLAFTVEHENSDRHELYIVGVDGTQPAVMITDDMIPTDNNSFTLDREAYDWSPDGQRLAYIADQDSAGDAELFTVFANGFGKFTLMNTDLVIGGDVVGFKWSPDSQRILYRADQDENGVYEMYSSESLPNNLLINAKMNVEPVDGGNVSSSYDWSHDGTHVAFIGDMETVDTDELYTSNFTGDISVKVSTDVLAFFGLFVNSFAWSPIENRLAYVIQDQDSSFLLTVLASGQEQSDEMNPDDTFVDGYEWAPDGSRVAFAVESIGERNLFTASVDGSVLDPINLPGIVDSFAWSPDSQSLAYTSDQDTAGKRELFTADFDGQNLIKVSNVIADGGNVARFLWSPDGQSLAYRADQEVDDTLELYVVNRDAVDRVKVSTSLPANGDVDTFQWRP